jgi:hypothetical protein
VLAGLKGHSGQVSVAGASTTQTGELRISGLIFSVNGHPNGEDCLVGGFAPVTTPIGRPRTGGDGFPM